MVFESVKHYSNSIQFLVQKCLDQQKPVFARFIDYEKVFDNVKHDISLKRLENEGLDSKDINIIKQLYCNQSTDN